MTIKEELIKRRNEILRKPFEIEHGFPIPARNQTPRSMYPFDSMEVGDSFKVAVIATDKIKNKMNKIGSAWSQYRKKGHLEKHFTCRHIPAEAVVRVWRIE